MGHFRGKLQKISLEVRSLKYKYKNINLNEAEKFKLKVLDAYMCMKPKNVRYLCKLFGIGKSTFYRWLKEYKPNNLASLKYKSRRPKTFKSIDWKIVIEICEWKRKNPRKSQYYLYQLLIFFYQLGFHVIETQVG